MSARSASTCLTGDSTFVIISVVGMPAGVTAKFRPFFSRDTSASLRDLDDKLTTQLVLSTKDVVVGQTDQPVSRANVFQTCAVDELWWYSGTPLYVQTVSFVPTKSSYIFSKINPLKSECQ